MRHLALPRGITVVGPDLYHELRTFENRWFQHVGLYGFRSFRIPPLGFAATFKHGHHAAGDKIYEFDDRKGRRLALVSDSLAAGLRYASGVNLPEQRLAFNCPVFRYLRIQERYFSQMGAMVLLAPQRATPRAGFAAMENLLQAALGFLKGQVSFYCRIGHMALWRPPAFNDACLIDMMRLPLEQRPEWLAAQHAPDEMVKLASLVAKYPEWPLDSPAWAEARKFLGAFGNHALQEAERLMHTAAAVIGPQQVALALGDLHAVEFHDGLTFRLYFAHDHQLFSDGGAYKRYACQFLGKPYGLYSLAIGSEMLFDQFSKNTKAADIYIYYTQEPGVETAMYSLENELRARGIRVWSTDHPLSVKQHLRDAEAVHIPFFMIFGSQELSTSQVQLRRLSSGERTMIPLASLPDQLSEY